MAASPSMIGQSAVHTAPTTPLPTSSSGGAYVPRWKRDPTAKPEPYKLSGATKPGEYRARQIGYKLNVAIHHSFLVGRRAADSADSATESTDYALDNTNSHEFANGPKEEIRCILNYPGANLPSTEAGVQVIWTRHTTGTIMKSIGQAYPFFTCTTTRTNRAGQHKLIFKFDGQYRIESAVVATQEEVLEFVKAREQSRLEKPAEVWHDKLKSTWLKVTLRGCAEEEQTGNPMEQ